MSLTTVLTDPAIKAKFKERFPVPKMLYTDIRAEPLTKKYSLVGTAFDYIVRFHIKRLFPKAVDRKWIAEEAVDQIKLYSWKYMLSTDGILEPINPKMLPDEQTTNREELRRIKSAKEWADKIPVAENVLDRAKKHYNEFLKTGEMTRDLFTSSMELALLDAVFRTGTWFAMPTVTDDDIKDLENLYEIMKSSDIMAFAEMAFRNPTFGKGSKLVGGADADLITDRILIDIKTTKSNSFTQDMYNQLLGYYALSTFRKDIDGIIELGIYFSRYGVLDVVAVPDADAVKEIIGWFEDYRVLQDLTAERLI